MIKQTAEKVLSILNNRLENRIYLFKEQGRKDEVVYDDGSVHVTRGGWRFCLDTVETSNESRIAKLENYFARIVDKAIADVESGKVKVSKLVSGKENIDTQDFSYL